jgi:nucleoid-associated protein YgaU
MDMGKYVAVGVLAVIVLAAATYDKPKTKAGAESAQSETAQAEEPVYAVDYGALDANETAAVTSAVSPAIGGPAPVAPAPAPVAISGETAIANLSQQVEEAKKTYEYVVKANQTLSDVAEEVLGDRKAWRKIYEANKHILNDPNHVRAGMKLVYEKLNGAQPAPARPRARARSVPASAPRAAGRTYTVKKGEGLWAIAKSQLGKPSRWKEIAKLNGIDDSSVRAGQVLKMPAR